MGQLKSALFIGQCLCPNQKLHGFLPKSTHPVLSAQAHHRSVPGCVSVIQPACLTGFALGRSGPFPCYDSLSQGSATHRCQLQVRGSSGLTAPGPLFPTPQPPPANIPRAGHKHSAPWTALTCTPHAKVGARISLKTTCKLGTLLPKQNEIVIIMNKYTQLHNQFS